MSLLPCPFCGSLPLFIEIGNDLSYKRSVIVKCPNCRIQRTDSALRKEMAWLRAIATENWNQRSKP
jgi:sarcosine oxidase delta subunit